MSEFGYPFGLVDLRSPGVRSVLLMQVSIKRERGGGRGGCIM